MEWSRLFTLTFFTQVLTAGVSASVPVVFAGLGETFTERSGVFNLGVEGIMLLGGLVGFVTAYYSGSIWVGAAAGLAAGALMGVVFAVWVVSLKANQIVTGYAMLALCSGLAIFLYRIVFPRTGRTVMPQIETTPVVHIPLLSSIPVIGPVLFQHDALLYVLYGVVIASLVVLYRTKFGLRVTAVGEYPAAADTLGVDVARVRYAAIIIGAALAGLGGAYFSISVLGLYNDAMIAGRGFIALALVIFGRWNPAWVFAGGILFGTIEALQSRLQYLGFPLPSEFLVMLPYVLTIVMVLIGKREARPSAMTIPYSREG